MSVYVGSRYDSSRNIDHILKYNAYLGYSTMANPETVSEVAKAYNKHKPYQMLPFTFKRVKAGR